MSGFKHHPKKHGSGQSAQGKKRERTTFVVIGGEAVRVRKSELQGIGFNRPKPVLDWRGRPVEVEKPRGQVATAPRGDIGAQMLSLFAEKGCPIQTPEERMAAGARAEEERKADELVARFASLFDKYEALEPEARGELQRKAGLLGGKGTTFVAQSVAHLELRALFTKAGVYALLARDYPDADPDEDGMRQIAEKFARDVSFGIWSWRADHAMGVVRAVCANEFYPFTEKEERLMGNVVRELGGESAGTSGSQPPTRERQIEAAQEQGTSRRANGEVLEITDYLEVARDFVRVVKRIKCLDEDEARELCAECGIRRERGDNRSVVGYVLGVLAKQASGLLKLEKDRIYEPGMEREFLREEQWRQAERLTFKLVELPEQEFEERGFGRQRETGFRQTCSSFLEIPNELGRVWIGDSKYDYSDWVSAKEYANEIVLKEHRRVPEYYVGLIREAVDAHSGRGESRFGSRQVSRGRDQGNREADPFAGTWFGRGNDFEF